MEKPLITIGIPTYNGGNAVRKAVGSILNQSYTNVDVLIADNASTNDTPAICRELTENYPQVRYHRHVQNIGMLPNFEFLLKHARGKYFMWLADDDQLASGILGTYVNFLEENPDFSLVSGKIEYRQDGKIAEYEQDFNFYQRSSVVRVIKYYFRVVHGAMYHGLMRSRLAQQVDLRKVIGSDWHFVANLAFLGKIKNLDVVGYHKQFGGASRNFKHYVTIIGESPFAGKYPHIKIALDAWREAMYASPVFRDLPFTKKVILASGCCLAVLISYYGKIYPFIVGGRMKRLLEHVFSIKRAERNDDHVLAGSKDHFRSG